MEKATQLRHSSQAAVALADEMARIARAVWRHERRSEGNHLPQAA